MIHYKIEYYLDTVCYWLPTMGLRKRTRRELSEHFEDILDDYAEQGIGEDEAVDRAIKEMGDPNELHKQLKKAHRVPLWYARFRNALIAVFCIFFLYFGYPISKDIGTYISAKSFEEAEESMYSDPANIDSDIKFVCKQKYNGKVYYIYYSTEDTVLYKGTEFEEVGKEYKIHTFESINVFGREFTEKFTHTTQRDKVEYNNDNIYKSVFSVWLSWLSLYDSEEGTEAQVVLFLGKTSAKYFTVDLYSREEVQEELKSDSFPEPYKSNFYEVPEAPGYVLVEAPEGFSMGTLRLYDKNKQELTYSGEVKNND